MPAASASARVAAPHRPGHTGLARRPAQVIVRYLDGHRVEYANPLNLPLLVAITWLLFRGRGRGYAEHLVINAYSMSAVNILYLLLFVALLVVDGTPAFRIAWVVGSAVPLAYKMVVFYAVFAGAGRRWSTALRSLAAMAVAFGLQFALMAGVDNWLLAHVPI